MRVTVRDVTVEKLSCSGQMDAFGKEAPTGRIRSRRKVKGYKNRARRPKTARLISGAGALAPDADQAAGRNITGS
jgi:hypothetical protein